MMKKFRGYIAGIITGALIFSVPAVASSVKEMIDVYFNTITVTVDGVKVEADNILYNDRTYVPLRAISEITGKTVTWDDATKTANIHDSYGVTYTGDVIGNVNGCEITSEQLEIYKTLVKLENDLASDVLDEEIERLAKEKIVYDIALKDKAKEFGIEINKEVDDNFKLYMDYLNAQYPEYMEILKAIGYTEKSFKQSWQTDFLLEMIITSSPMFNPSQDEIEAYYNTNKQDFKYDGLIAKHILISTIDETGKEVSEEKKAELKKTADDIYKKIKNGEDFDTLMREFNEDPGVEKNPDGYKFTRGEMIKEFENTAYSLEIGQVSEPVLSSYGYHIIKLVDKIEYLSLEEAKEDISNNLSKQNLENAIKLLTSSYKVIWN